MVSDYYDFQTEISPLGELYAAAHFNLIGSREYPIDPEIIAAKYHGLEIRPVAGLSTVNVKAGIDATQSVLFIDSDLYTKDNLQYLARQTIAHELGHIIFDSPAIRQNAPSTAQESFAAHTVLTSRNGVESRANMFAGAFLVPRHELIRKSATIIFSSLPDLKQQYPHMRIQDMMFALAASKLTKQFCVSDSLIEWRLRQENVAALFGGADARVEEIDELVLGRFAETSHPETHDLAERVKRLLPPELTLFLKEAGM